MLDKVNIRHHLKVNTAEVFILHTSILSLAGCLLVQSTFPLDLLPRLEVGNTVGE